MNTTQSATTDYRKWLLYSFDSQNFESHYNLFKALKSGQSFGTIRMASSEDSGVRIYTIAAENIREELLIDEDKRTHLIKYLVDNYFHTEDVDGILVEKTQKTDSSKNHGYLESADKQYFGDKSEYRVKPHPKESTYFNAKLVVSVIFYALVLGLIVYSALVDLSSLLLLLPLVPFVLIVMLFARILQGIFVGMIRGNSIRITKEQYPEIYKIIEEQAAQLKIDELPEIYITSGHFNAFVTKLSRAHILMVYSEVVETALRGNYDVLKYVTAHELCHIKQKHLSKEKYLFPSRMIPFLGLAYSRGCEYTCDRAGYDFSPKGSIEGILIMTTGKEIHSKFNIELHIKNSVENEGFWTWLSEKFLTHPHLYKRLVQISEYSK